MTHLKRNVVGLAMVFFCCFMLFVNVKLVLAANTNVQKAQQVLSERGYRPGPVAGLFGRKTSEALKKFQKDNNLPITGHIDESTAKALGVNKYVPSKREKYKPVHPNEIACALKDYNYDGIVAGGGAVKPIGGHIGEFHCGLGFDAGSKRIELAANEFKEGGVATKEFGVIKVRFSSSLTSGGYMLMMTDVQKEKIKAFLAE